MTVRRLLAGVAGLVLLGVAGVRATARAQGAPPPAELPEIVVSADRLPQPRADVPAHVTVLDDERLARTPSLALDDVLRQVPGFQLFRRQSSLVANPTAQGVSLRGLGGSGASRTLVLLDGVPLNDPFGGWVAWSRVPPDALEHVELVRGPSATVWGNAAMGGVIALETRPPGGRSGALGADGGENALWYVATEATDDVGPLALRLRASHLDFGGVPVIRQDQRGAIDVDASSRDTVVDGRARWSASPRLQLDAHVNGFLEERGNGTPDTDNATAAGDADLALLGTDGWGGRWRATAFGRVQRYESRFSTQAPDRGSERPALDQFDVPSTAGGASLVWHHATTLAWLPRLAAGGDAMRIDGETHEDLRFVDGAFRRRRQAGGRSVLAGVWGQLRATPLPRLEATATLRLDGWWFRAGSRDEQALPSGVLERRMPLPGHDALLADPSLGLRWQATDDVALRAGVYRGFRAPTLNELVRPFRVRNDVTEANPALRPERLWGGEVGVERGGRRWDAQVTGFAQRLDDPIVNATAGAAVCGPLPPGGSCRQRRNLGATRIVGVEADAAVRPHADWQLRAGWTFVDAEIIEAAGTPDLVGRTPPQVPDQQASGEVVWSRPRWPSVSVQLRYVGRQYEDDRNTIALGGFAVLDAALGWHVTERIELRVAVENALDRVYPVGRTADGLATVGLPRLVHGGVRMHF